MCSPDKISGKRANHGLLSEKYPLIMWCEDILQFIKALSLMCAKNMHLNGPNSKENCLLRCQVALKNCENCLWGKCKVLEERQNAK
jgi:hypothetical protein